MSETISHERPPTPAQTPYARLMASVEEAMHNFDRQAKSHKQLHRSLRILGFTLTGIATVLAAAGMLAVEPAPKLQFLIVLVTAVATAIAAYEGLRNPSELWLNERGTCHALKDLLRELEYRGPSGVPDPDIYFDRLQAIIQSSGERWSKSVRATQTLDRTPAFDEPPAAPPADAPIKMPV